MNKKIIAIAIASALAAPVAMADMVVSGAFTGDLVSRNNTAADAASTNENAGESSLTMDDFGGSKIQFDATAGAMYGRFGFNVGPAKSTTAGEYRDWYIGYKFDGGSTLQMGIMASEMQNLEKDAYIATFLQTRGTYAEANTSGKPYGNSGFVHNVLEFATKVNGVAIKAQYNPLSKAKDSTISDDEGHMGISAVGSTNGIGWFAAYNNGKGNDASGTKDSNMKIGGSMKFGTINAGLNYQTADNGTNKWNAVVLDATMDMGNGLSANVNFGSTGGDAVKQGTSTRVAITKDIAKGAKIYGGVTNKKPKSSSAQQMVGFGMQVKF